MKVLMLSFLLHRKGFSGSERGKNNMACRSFHGFWREKLWTER